jgi:predicted alpha/beta hydrolase
MEVRSAKIFAIFACHIKSNRILTLYGVNASMRLTKALHELLKMIIMQTLVTWQMFVVIGQRDKTIICIPTSLMQTSNRPLARTLKPTTYALTAWQREAAHDVVPGALIENNVPCCRFPRR